MSAKMIAGSIRRVLVTILLAPVFLLFFGFVSMSLPLGDCDANCTTYLAFGAVFLTAIASVFVWVAMVRADHSENKTNASVAPSSTPTSKAKVTFQVIGATILAFAVLFIGWITDEWASYRDHNQGSSFTESALNIRGLIVLIALILVVRRIFKRNR